MIQEQNVVPEKKVIREQNVKQALYAAMAVGEAILEYGGEVSRVEDIRRAAALRTSEMILTSWDVSTTCPGSYAENIPIRKRFWPG